jgi:hypothetical protein
VGKDWKDFQSFLIFFLFRTTVSVIIISTLLLYRALVAQVEQDDNLNDDINRIQKLEKRVLELEAQLQRNHAPPQRAELNPVPLPLVLNHPIDVAFLNYKDRKRILITGGAGFVGSHLTDKLMLEGHEVIVADNMFTGKFRMRLSRNLF